MSKQVFAATERQGCSTPTTIPKQAALVKKIRAKFQRKLLTPIENASDKTFNLSVLLATIKDIADSGADSAANSLKIKVLADVALSEADCIGEILCDVYLDHGPAILAAVGGAA